MSKKISLIWAEGEGGVIGKDGILPWDIPEDMQHFKETTEGNTVIMGRKTWESIPESVRPLPNRQNIVISRTVMYEAPGALVVGSLEEAISFAQGPIWVMGGGAVFKEAIKIADELVVTKVALAFISGILTHAPQIEVGWTLTDQTTQIQTASGVDIKIKKYQRKVQND